MVIQTVGVDASSADAGPKPAPTYELAKMFATRDSPRVAYIQRRMGIAYNLAASYVERLEKEGFVSSSNYAGVRQILIPWPEEARPAQTVENSPGPQKDSSNDLL